MNQHPQECDTGHRPGHDPNMAATLAAMREALEGVWKVCSHEHWPKIGAALEDDAGEAFLERLRKAEVDRDLLMAALRPFVEALEAHDRIVREAARYSSSLPNTDDDAIRTEELPLREFRRVRKVLHAVEASPERAAELERALLAVEGYANIRDGRCIEAPKSVVLHQLSEEIPALVARSLTTNPPPAPHDDPTPEESDELLRRKIHDYEQALGEIGESARFANADQQEHELLHLLEVELPDIASRTLDEYREEPREENKDADPDDDFWIPF